MEQTFWRTVSRRCCLCVKVVSSILALGTKFRRFLWVICGFLCPTTIKVKTITQIIDIITGILHGLGSGAVLFHATTHDYGRLVSWRITAPDVTNLKSTWASSASTWPCVRDDVTITDDCEHGRATPNTHLNKNFCVNKFH